MSHVIDVHTHFLPESMIDTLRAGQVWHGWRTDRGPDGTERIVSDGGIAPFPLAMADQEWPDRISGRREAGIDVQAIMLPTFLWSYHLPGAEAAAFCRDVNTETADLRDRHPDAIVPMGVLPLQDADRAVSEIEHAVRELGIGTFSIGTHVQGKNLDDPHVVRILEAVCEAGAGLMVHASYFDRAGAERMQRYDFGNSIGVPLEAGLSMMSIIYSGILDRYPDARIGSCHGGGWASFGVGRLWLRYTQGRDGGHLTASPAEYLRKLFYDCLLHDELSLGLLIERVGASQVMIGTDHPYKGDIPGGAVSWIKNMASLDDRQKSAILTGNAARFLGRDA